MKHLYKILLAALAALLASACGKDTETDKTEIAVESLRTTVTSDSHQAEIRYEIRNAAPNLRVAATADDGWLHSIDCSQQGIVRFAVERNEQRTMRSTALHLACPGATPVDITVDQLPEPVETAEQTLIYYFVGTSLGRYFDYNIEDTMTAISEDILGTSRVIYLRQHSATEADICELRYDPAGKSCIRQHLESIELPEEQITADDMARNLQRIAAMAPAKRYGLIMAGHSTGWVTREAEQSQTSMLSVGGGDIWQPAEGAETVRTFGERKVKVDIEEIARALTIAQLHPDYILFDACFMSNIEALYDLRDVTDHIIASPCEIMGRGFPYHRTLPYLMADGGSRSDLAAAAESYYLYYRDEYKGAARCGSIAVIDCREIEALAEATRTLLATAKSDYDASQLQTYEGQRVHTYYDFGQFINTVATDAEALAEFERQLSRTVTAKYTLPTAYSALGSYGTFEIDTEIYSGVTTSEPSANHRTALEKTAWRQFIR